MFISHVLRVFGESLSNRIGVHKFHSLPHRNILFQCKDNSSIKHVTAPFRTKNVFARKIVTSAVRTQNVSDKAGVSQINTNASDDPVIKDTTTTIENEVLNASCDDPVVKDSTVVENVTESTESTLQPACVFIRGLPYSVTEESIIKFFKPLGIVPSKVSLRYDRYGNTNGKAEVEFKNEADAQKALQKHNDYIENRYIELSLTPFPLMNADRVQFMMRGMGSRDARSNFRNSYSSTSVKLAGLPYSCKSDDIIEFFKPLNIEPVEIDIKFTDQGYPTGLCFVKFKSDVDAMKALQNNNKYIGDRYIRVTLPQFSRNRAPYSGVMYNDQPSFNEPYEDARPFKRF